MIIHPSSFHSTIQHNWIIVNKEVKWNMFLGNMATHHLSDELCILQLVIRSDVYKM